MTRALITGVMGQDGSYMAELLTEKGYDVYGLYNENDSQENISHIMPKIKLVRGNLRDKESLKAAIRKSEPDEVYNFAGISFVPSSFDAAELTGDVNGLGVVRLLEAIRSIKDDAKMYQASSSEMFGNAEKSPQNETTPFRPRNPYAVTKVFAHEMVRYYRDIHGMFACCGIAFNHESPRRPVEYVSRKITHGVARIHLGLSKELNLGNLDARRDWGYAGDYVKAMWLMLQQRKADDFVIATGETHSVRDFVKRSFDVMGIGWEKYVKKDQAFFRPTDRIDLCGDVSKARRLLGWSPSVTFDELVRMMVEADISRLRSMDSPKKP